MRLGLGLGQEASAAPGSPWVALVSAHLSPRGLHQLHRMGLQTLSSQEPQEGRQGLSTPGTLEQLKESKEKEEEEGQQPRIISAVTVCPRLCSGPWV